MAQYLNDIDQGSPGSPLGHTMAMGWGLMKWNYSFATLGMLAEAPRKGYFVPWTKGWFGPKGRGLAYTKIHPRAIQMAEKRLGFWGLGTGSKALYGKQAIIDRSMKAGFGEVGARKLAASAFGSAIIGRAAGMALRIAAPWMLASFGITLGKMAWDAVARPTSKYWGLELGGYFPETQASYTSRQRNLQAITSSQLQARSAIGNEAMMFHR